MANTKNTKTEKEQSIRSELIKELLPKHAIHSQEEASTCIAS